MSSSTTPNTPIDTFDILGCGFGPANLAIAVALVDKWSTENGKRNERAIFVEKYSEFRWHPGMLIPGARMQISCLKDLATLRSPSSPFTFLSYLHSQKRLVAFINRGSTIPSRREFADYLAWGAREVARRGVNVAYAEEVVAISKVFVDERELIEVTSRRSPSGEVVIRRTKHIILSAGGSPRLPRVLASLQPQPWTQEGMLRVPVLHTASYITSVGPLLSKLSQSGAPLRIAVVGGGQSSAECMMDIYRRLEGLHTGGHRIDMIIRKGCLKPSDDSPFVNEIFDPATTDQWYNLPSDRQREQLHSEYKNTNYSVVNPLTLESVFELVYDQKLSDDIASRDSSSTPDGDVRLMLRHNENVIGASLVPQTEGSTSSQKVILTRQQVRSHEIIEDAYDAVICGTGYERTAWLNLLRASNLAKDYGLAGAADGTPVQLIPEHRAVNREADDELPSFKSRDASPEIDHASTTESSPSTPPSSPSLSLSPETFHGPIQVPISRAYRLLPTASAHGTENRVYLQGCAEATHGLSDTLLSVIGVRSGEVVDDIWAEKN